jgi:hypothetical protein
MVSKHKAVVAGWIALAAVVACGVNTAISRAATGLAPDTGFMPLHPIVYLPFTVFGLVVGAVGWAMIGRTASRPAALLRRLVPVVLLVSFVPDLALAAVMPSGLVQVLALMLMHVVVVTVGVPVFARALPVSAAPVPTAR